MIDGPSPHLLCSSASGWGARTGLSSQSQPRGFPLLSRPILRPCAGLLAPPGPRTIRAKTDLAGGQWRQPSPSPPLPLPRAAGTSLAEWMALVRGEGSGLCFVHSLPCLLARVGSWLAGCSREPFPGLSQARLVRGAAQGLVGRGLCFHGLSLWGKRPPLSSFRPVRAGQRHRAGQGWGGWG